MENPVIIILIVAIVVTLVIFMVRSAGQNKDEKRVPNYRALFIIGVTWLPIGIATDNPGFWVMGLVFMIIGLKNKNKWGQETKWADLSPRVRRLKIIVLGGLTIILMATILYFLLTRSA